jgi:uncharacterized protein YbcI
MPDTEPILRPARPVPRSPLQAIADAAARHYKEQFGRGPVRCTAHSAGRDAVVIVLDGTLNPAELRLAREGEAHRVRSLRTLQQHAVQEELRTAVERLVGRSVVQAVSGVDVHRDVASEFFAFAALEPEVTRAA